MKRPRGSLVLAGGLALLALAGGCRRSQPDEVAPPLWGDVQLDERELARLPPSFGEALEQARRRAAPGADPATHDPGAVAELLQANGFYPEAAERWQALLALDPAKAKWTYFLADVYRQTGDDAAAHVLMQRVVELAPTYGRAWLRVGDHAFKQGDLAAARAAYERLLTLEPGSSYGELGLARVEARSGQVDAAMARLRSLIERDPGFVSAHSVLAQVLDETGRPQEAEAARRAAAALPRFVEAEDPWLRELYQKSHDPERLVLWGTYARHAGRLDEAARFFELAIERAPERSAAYEFLGRMRAAGGAHAEAVEVLRRGLMLADATETMVVELVEALMVRRQLDEALAAAERGLARFGESALIMNALGRVQALRGEPVAALSAFDRALAWLPNYADPALNQALVQLGQGDRTAAQAALDEALRRQPAFPRARVLRAEMAMAEGDLMTALDALQAAYEQSPGVPEVKQALARWFEVAIDDRLAAGDRAMAERLAREGGRLLPEIADALQARVGEEGKGVSERERE